jgi:hypothetical protein
MWHAAQVLVEVEVPHIVGEESSFGNYPKVTIIHEFLALYRSLSSISSNHSLQSCIP